MKGVFSNEKPQVFVVGGNTFFSLVRIPHRVFKRLFIADKN